MLDAALAGAGIAYLWDWSVADHVAAGRLLRVLEDWTPRFPGLRLYYPGRLSAGLRALVDLVHEVGS